jgi:S1-C subfamily serine protease
VNPLDGIAVALLVIAVILGARSGALPQVGGLIGAAAGAFGAINVIPIVLPRLDEASAPIRVAAVLLILLVFVGIGEAVGARGGRAVSASLGDGVLGALDRVGGAIVGAGQAVLIVWLLGGVLVTGLVPSLSRDAQTSVAVRGIDVFLPPPTEIVLQLGKALDESGLPDVFLGLERLPADPVALPDEAVADAIGRQALASVPRVEADACSYRSTGTGVVVKAGYVVTNAHVVAGARTIAVVTTTGRLPAIPVLVDPELDVAVLAVPGLTASPLFFATSEPSRGAVGATIGYPDGGAAVIGPAAVADTYVAEGLDIEGRARVSREIIELRAVVDPGDSGGPLLLPNLSVAGLVFAESRSDPAVGYALSPVEVARAVTPALGRTAAVSTGPCLH